MKKILTLILAAVLFLPAYSLMAKQSSVSTVKSAESFQIAANDEAELKPAESEKKAETSTETPAEEKKESKAGFFAGVALMVVFIIVILMKTKKMTND